MPILAGISLMLRLRPRSPSLRRAIATRAALVRVGLGFFLLLFITAPAKADFRKREYVNARYGFNLLVPATFVAGPKRGDGSGCEFHTGNDEFKVFAFALAATTSPEEEINRLFAREKDLFGSTVTYQVKERQWFVLSGVAQNGTEFYSKVSTKGSTTTFLRMTARPASALR